MTRRDFFERQDRARRQTVLLIGGFILAVAGVVVAVNLVVWLVASSAFVDAGSWTLREWLTSPGAAGTAGVTIAVIAFGSTLRATQLAHGGGGRVATLLGGRIIDPDTSDAGERRLINVVEEIAIAAGMPPPDVYVLDREQGINAFAAGLTPANAAVAFTAGALERLDRDELQGVVAHEFSHIANGDMRINVRLLALLAGVTLIGEMGASAWRGVFMRRGLHGRGVGHRRGGGDARAVLVMLGVGLALMIIGWLGVLVGRVIKAGVSRQREFLADAAAVQFTRDPHGIAGALLKIADNRNGGMLAAGRAEEISHMGFARTVGGLTGLTRTHPPIEERLRAISPQYVPIYRQQQRARARNARRERSRRDRAGGANAVPAEAGPNASGPLGDLVPDPIDAATPGHVASLLSIAAIGALAGNPRATRLDAARELLARVPPAVYDALHRPESARRLVWALLLAEPDYARRLPAAESGPTLELRQDLESAWGDGSGNLQARVRLPLVELALPALRRLDDAGRRILLERLDDLIRADGRLAVHEYALRTLLLHRLFERERPAIGRGGLGGATTDVDCVLSVLCHAIQGGAEARQRAWRAAHDTIAADPATGDEPLGREECSLRAFSAALEKLSGLQPRARRDLLAACVACVTSDGRVTAAEAELLRCIAAVLDTPIPPLDDTATAP